MKNVPPSMFSWKGLNFLASPVGVPIRLHQETELVTSFDEAKIFVGVDLTKDLPKHYFSKSRMRKWKSLLNTHGFPYGVGFAESGDTLKRAA